MRTLALHAACLVFGWSTLAVYSIHAAMPFNPVRLPFEDSLRVSRLLPQGWAFFTRDPREERLTVHRLRDGRLVPAGRSPHVRAANAFGLNRVSRAEGVELELLVAAAEQRATGGWTPCATVPAECARALIAIGGVHDLDPVVPRPLVCGDVILKLEAPVPWAWSRFPPPSSRCRLLAVRVRC